MDQQFSGACPSSMFREEEVGQEMEFEMNAPGAYFSEQQDTQRQFRHEQPIYVDHNSYGAGFPLHVSDQYSAMNFEYQTYRSHERHHSTSTQSTQSTHSSALRSSDGSVFSRWDPRSSVASTNTTFSQFSEVSRDLHIAQTERLLDSRSPFTSPPPSALIEEPVASPVDRPISQRQPVQKREPFLTCVSRTKRSRRSQKALRYWCTSCGDGFGEKYDWKRHEETYQERTEMYECDLCKNVYFLDRDFVHHHQRSHRCQVCVEKQHVSLAKKKRMARTGWGCGFCNHFSSDWTERCNHISRHFENGKTMANWHHSQVIFSLLHRPEIIVEWCRLLESKQRTKSTFGWNLQNTGRVEGYPEANAEPQLQDLLEYYVPEKNPAAVARLAFDKGLREKELPRPPVPEKDSLPPHTMEQTIHQSMQHPTLPPSPLQDPLIETPSWMFLSPIPEDEIQAANVCILDRDMLNAAFNDVPHEFHSF